jgi:hypothetical protein
MVNLGLHSLFRQVEVTLNSTSVSNDVGCHYPYKALLDVLLLYGYDVKETMLQCEMYFKDTAGAMEQVTGGTNAGLQYRYGMTKKVTE